MPTIPRVGEIITLNIRPKLIIEEYKVINVEYNVDRDMTSDILSIFIDVDECKIKNKIKINDCLHCGSKSYVKPTIGRFQIYCSGCHIQTPYRDSEEKAIEMWNLKKEFKNK